MKFRKDFLIAGYYTLLTIILTYPVAFRLGSEIAGFKGEDNLQWRWFLWWFKHALLNLHTSVTQVSLLYAPLGGEQPLYAITVYIPALALPITLLGGPTVSFNLSFLLSFALSGYTTYLLAYYLVRHRLAAFIAGLIFAFYPARFGYATGTFLGQLTTYFLPLYVLALFMLARQPNHPSSPLRLPTPSPPRLLRRAIWAAIVLACLCLTWPLHVAYGAVVFTFPFLIVQIVAWLRGPETRPRLKYFALTFGLAFLLIIGPYLPLLRTALRGDNSHLGDTTAINFSLDLLAFITPSNYHPVLQPLHLLPGYTQHVLADRDDIQERLAYVGLLPMLLILIGVAKSGRRLLFWLLIALGAMILSLGPLLKFNGNLVQLNIEGYVGYVVLPYALLHSVPILDWSGVLGRLNVATMLCVAVMAAYGMVHGLSRFRNNWQPGLVMALSGLILFEFLTIFPFPTEPDVVPDFYYQLKQEAVTQPQAIIDLPLAGDPSYNNYSMHYQTVHQQPIAGGHFMRKPAGAREMTAFVNQLLLPPLNQPVLGWPDAQARLGLLNKFNFTRIIARLPLMKDEAAKTQLTYLSSWLGLLDPPNAGEVAVFDVPPGGTPLKITPLLAGDGWQLVEDSAQLQLQSPADLLVYVNDEQGQPIRLNLSLAASEPDRYLSIDLDSRPMLRLYLSQEILDYHIPFTLQPGAHQLTFYPEETCQQDCAPINFIRIALDSSVIDESQPITFANQLTLLADDLSSAVAKPGQSILVYLYWRGQGRMNKDYSAFVHLVSPSGELIGQADYLLGGWLYPTSNWPDEYIATTPSLLFVPPAATPGEYQLRAGVYHAETGERLLTNTGATGQDSALVATITVTP